MMAASPGMDVGFPMPNLSSSNQAGDTTPPFTGRDFFRGPPCFAASNSQRKRAWIFALVFAASLALYLFLLPPSISRGGDTGELIAASYNLGIAHPSGYPIWCQLSRIFAFLPMGEIAWRYNFFSALCGALAAATLAVTSHRLIAEPTRRARLASIGAGLLFAGFFWVGSQAIIAEVYALAALEGAALLYFALAWKQNRDWRDLYTLAFLAGISPLIHLSGVFLWPILGVWALWKAPDLRASRLAVLVMLGASGWIFALYFPLRSANFPPPPVASLDAYFYLPLDWGHPVSFAALKNHLTAAQYSKLLQPRALPDLLDNLAHLGHFLLIQYLWATPLLIVGAVAAFKRGVGWVLLLIWVFNVGVEIQYDVGDQSNFFFPAYLVMALWMALGWCEFLGWMKSAGHKLARGASTSLWPWRLQTLGALILLATIGAQWFLFAAGASQRGVVRPRDGALESARAAQQLAARNGKSVAALFVFDDTLWPFWYAKYVLNEAPDVETPWGRGLQQLAESGKLANYVAQLKRSGPVALAQWDEATDARFPLVMLTPSGNLCEASNRALPPPATPLRETINNSLNGPNGLRRARIRRAALWRGEDDVPALSPASLAAFETDFQLSKSQKPRFIEVLIAQRDFWKTGPTPTQQNVTQGAGETQQILVSRQKRRLILPPNADSGLWRAAVPLQIEATSPLGNYEIWTRLVASPDDVQTAWTHSDSVLLTSK